jgi:hypothetical protein
MSFITREGQTFPIVVNELVNTCGACPSQWEGKTEGGDEVYIRYRWGYFSFDLNGVEVIGGQIGDSYDGVMSDYELNDHLRQLVIFT